MRTGSGRKKINKDTFLYFLSVLFVCVCLCDAAIIQTPKLEAAKRSEADTLVEAVV